MPTTYKVLAQAAPAATTETTLYTVPSSTSAVVSTMAIANQAGTSGTYRIVVRPAADASTTQKHYIVYGATVGASDSIMLTLGLTLATGDVVRVYASSANMSFSAFGSEIS
jgi:hypothetical protein